MSTANDILFDSLILSILKTKKDASADIEYYKPFIVNRKLSYHIDCVLYANEINKHPDLPHILQYHYFLNTIRPMNRKFQPWQSKVVGKDLECVMEYYGYSYEKAKQALRILTKEQVASIQEKLDKGGLSK